MCDSLHPSPQPWCSSSLEESPSKESSTWKLTTGNQNLEYTCINPTRPWWKKFLLQMDSFLLSMDSMRGESISSSLTFALIPIVKVLFMCAIGYLLATDRIGLLTPSGITTLSKVCILLLARKFTLNWSNYQGIILVTLIHVTNWGMHYATRHSHSSACVKYALICMLILAWEIWACPSNRIGLITSSWYQDAAIYAVFFLFFLGYHYFFSKDWNQGGRRN